jgi:hypothetical protein
MKRLVELIYAEKFYLILFLIGLSLVFYLTRNFVDSADLIQYLAISRAYSNAEFIAAINDFWSPLLSWVLLPISRVCGDELLAFKFLQSICCIAAFLFAIRWSNQLSLSGILKAVFLFVFALFFFSCAFFNGSPDLLYLVLLLLLFYFIEKSMDSGKIKVVCLSITGVMLYFAKGFGFVFFISFLLFLFVYFRGRKFFFGYQLLRVFALFLLLCLPWIILISIKSGHVEVSGASRYNFNLMHPSINPNVFAEIKHPITFAHYKPPDKSCWVSAWQNPNSFSIQHWSPLDDFTRYFKIVGRNIISLVYYYYPFFLAIAISIALLFFDRAEKLKQRFSFQVCKNNFLLFFRTHCLVVLAAVLTTFLYSLILTQPRYLWINNVALLLFFFFTINQLKRKNLAFLIIIPFFLSSVYFFAKDLKAVLNSPLNSDWKHNQVSAFLLKNSKNKNVVSDISLGADGYTINCSLGFFTGAKNAGCMDVHQVESVSGLSFFLSGGNRTISTDEFPLLDFCAYDSSLNISLYRVKEK